MVTRTLKTRRDAMESGYSNGNEWVMRRDVSIAPYGEWRDHEAKDFSEALDIDYRLRGAYKEGFNNGVEDGMDEMITRRTALVKRFGRGDRLIIAFDQRYPTVVRWRPGI